MAGTVLLVNGEPLEEAEILTAVAALRRELESGGTSLAFEDRVQLRQRAIAELVEQTLILQEYRRLGLKAPVENIERETERQLMFRHMLEHWCRNIRHPKSTEVRDYYRAHQDQFWRPESVHAAHLVRNTEGRDRDPLRLEMEALRDRLLAGEAFAELAAAASDCPENGGDLGFFARGVMVDEFDAVVFDAPLREPTPVFETRFGLHVAMVLERRQEGVLKLEDVFGEIGNSLYRVKQDREAGRQLDALRKKAVVQVI